MTTPKHQFAEVPEAILTASDELNSTLLNLDAVVQLSVISRAVATPPPGAVQGDTYIIPAGATGVWLNRTNHIAFMGPQGWLIYVPRPGWLAWSQADAAFYFFDIGTWSEMQAGGGPGSAIEPRGGAWSVGSGFIVPPVDDVSLYFQFACTIVGVVLMTRTASGSCVVDIFKDPFSSYPPTTSICAAAKPTISSGLKYIDTTLTGWTTAIAAGDVLGLHLESASGFRHVHCSLLLERA